jgi:hypothetical protein
MRAISAAMNDIIAYNKYNYSVCTVLQYDYTPHICDGLLYGASLSY